MSQLLTYNEKSFKIKHLFNSCFNWRNMNLKKTFFPMRQQNDLIRFSFSIIYLFIFIYNFFYS